MESNGSPFFLMAHMFFFCSVDECFFNFQDTWKFQANMVKGRWYVLGLQTCLLVTVEVAYRHFFVVKFLSLVTRNLLTLLNKHGLLENEAGLKMYVFPVTLLVGVISLHLQLDPGPTL